MIVVDSSAWIAQMRGSKDFVAEKLQTIARPGDIVVGDIILVEILQGARDDAHAAVIERHLREFHIRPMLDERLAVQAAKNYRTLRATGITVRKTIDMIIATFCVDGGHALLHDDRDFDPMVEHLGLVVV